MVDSKRENLLSMGMFLLFIGLGLLGVLVETNVVSAKQAEPATMTSITQADNGKQVTAKMGEDILLDLGSDYTWTVHVDNQQVLSQVQGVAIAGASQGLLEATNPGTTILSATGKKVCPTGQTQCNASTATFQVKVVVH